jgi:hypothetical protein
MGKEQVRSWFQCKEIIRRITADELLGMISGAEAGIAHSG